MSAKQVVESLYAAFNRGDIAAILSRVATDATWRQSPLIPWGGDYRGPEGAGQFFSKLNDAAETLAFHPQEIFENGNDVFSFGVWEGKSRKTGKTVRTNWMFRWRVENDKVTRYEGYQDSAAIVAAFT